MESADFRNGKYNTHFIEKNHKFLTEEKVCDDMCEDVAIMAVMAAYMARQEEASPSRPMGTRGNLWKEYGRRRSLLRL